MAMFHKGDTAGRMAELARIAKQRSVNRLFRGNVATEADLPGRQADRNA